MTPKPQTELTWMLAREKEEQTRRGVQEALAAQHCLTVTSTAFQAVWRYAWEQGHSAGYHEVEIYFHDIMRVIKEFQGE